MTNLSTRFIFCNNGIVWFKAKPRQCRHARLFVGTRAECKAAALLRFQRGANTPRMVAARWSKLACFVRIHCHHGPTFGFPQQQLGWPRRIARCGRAWAWDRAGHPEPGAISPKDLMMMVSSERRTFIRPLLNCSGKLTRTMSSETSKWFNILFLAPFVLLQRQQSWA